MKEPYIQNIRKIPTKQLVADMRRFRGAQLIQEYHFEYGNVEEECDLAKRLVNACRRELEFRSKRDSSITAEDLKLFAS